MNLCKVLFLSSFFFSVFTESVFGSETFVSNLKIGSQGKEVLLLQKVLNQDVDTLLTQNGSGSAGNETQMFGMLTHNAVIRFQEKHKEEILSPQNLSNGTGIVGVKTRAVLNRLLGNTSVTDTISENSNVPPAVHMMTTAEKLPYITSLSTGLIADPYTTPLVIIGENFTQKSQVYMSIEGVEIFNTPSDDGKTISVFLISALTNMFEQAIAQAILQSGGTQTRKSIIDNLKIKFNSTTRNGVYLPASVFVRTEYGESNKFQIKINVLKD